MAKKSRGSGAADAVKTVAGAALGAPAAAATGVILHSVAGAFGSGEKKLEQATPSVQQQVAAKVASKIAARKRPGKKATGKKKAARKAKAAVKKRPAARKGAKKAAKSKRGKKRGGRGCLGVGWV